MTDQTQPAREGRWTKDWHDYHNGTVMPCIRIGDEPFALGEPEWFIDRVIALEADLRHERELRERYEKAWHPEEGHRCGDCGGPHAVDTSLPSSIWNQIAEPHESLCTLCIEARLQAKGLTAEAKFYYAGEAMMGKLYDADFSDEIQEWAIQAHKHAEASAANYQRAERAEAELEALRPRAALAERMLPFLDKVDLYGTAGAATVRESRELHKRIDAEQAELDSIIDEWDALTAPDQEETQ